MVHEGHELGYDYGLQIGFLLILLSLMSAPLPSNQWRNAWSAGALGLVLLASQRVIPAMRPLLPRWAMLHRSFLQPGEIAKVRSFIATLPAGDSVDFGWSGMEPFFFADLTRVGAHWTIARHSVTEVWPLRTPEWRVRCDSSEWPRYLFQFDMDFPRKGADTGCDIIRRKPASDHPP